MKILADENIPLVTEAFASFGEVRTMAGRQLTTADVKDADVLLVRSVTPVNEALLSGSRVRFVGSATIGTDHIDLAWLAENDIQFANAPGCNAVSAAEYVLSALLTLDTDDDFQLAGKTLGIIGCGNVGSRVKARAEALGMQCLVCDPPRAEQEGGEGFVAMDEVVQADIISVHVPLIDGGSYPTRQLINAAFLEQLSPSTVFINTSRGEVADEVALLQKLIVSSEFKAVLDVWQNEPGINSELVPYARFATPHIAGYSIDGKIRATETLYHAVCDLLGRKQELPECFTLPEPQDAGISFKDRAAVDDIHAVLRDCLRHVYDVRRDDGDLREVMGSLIDEQAAGFDRLRKSYWHRRECSAYRVLGNGLPSALLPAIKMFGFTVV